MPVNDPSKPLSDYDRRKLDLLLERTPKGSPAHDAWLLEPQHDDHLYADALETLRLVNRLRARADAIEAEAIRLARASRFTWAQIGAQYGLSRQAAFNRWHDIDEVDPRLPLA
jgi:hypothetical protein